MSAIPHGDAVVDPRKQTPFGEAKKNAAGEKATEVVYKTHAGHYQAPGNSKAGQPDARTDSLHHDIAWNLGGDAEWEEDRKSDVIVAPFHPEIVFEANETGIADIRAIEIA